jgi:transposase
MAELSGERVLRAQLGELRAQVAERDRAIVLLSEENTALRDRLAGLAERVLELERRLGQTPRNSDRPPSSEGYAKPPPRSLRKPGQHHSGGQPGHSGTTLRRVATPDERVLHRPVRCAGCGASLAAAAVVAVERRQVFDLPDLRLRVIEHELARCRCRCGRLSAAPPPPGVGAPTQYGPGMRGLATYLLTAQHLPLARTAELCAELLAAPVSEGSLAAWSAAADGELAAFDVVLADRLAAAVVLGADETGIRVEGKTRWVHATCTDTLTRFTVSTRRGAPAMREADVLPRLAGEAVLVHDFWAAYWSFDVAHAVCGAHLLRELTAAAETDGQDGWAAGLAELLGELNTGCHAARAAGAPALDSDQFAGAAARYDALIAAGWAANPDHRPGQRFTHRRPPHVNLLDRLDGHREEVLRFAGDLRVPFTNNGTERDIRPLKIKLKVAGCWRTMAGAVAFCRLRSYLATARKHGHSAFAVLRHLAEGNPWMPPALAAT